MGNALYKKQTVYELLKVKHVKENLYGYHIVN